MDKRNSALNQEEVIGRIKQLLKEQHKLEKDIVEYLGIGSETFKNWKRGKSDSYLHFLVEISNYLGVTPNYLLLGAETAQTYSAEDLTEEERSLVEKYRKIGMNEKRYIRILLDGMTEVCG